MADITPAMTTAMLARWKATAKPRLPIAGRPNAVYGAAEGQRLADMPQPLKVGVPLDLAGYQPSFRDDFTSGLDPRWKVATDETGWGGELAAFTREALDTGGGQLTITASHLDKPVDGRDYATGSISLSEAFLYGYIEAKVWCDVRNGAHPAVWLYPQNRRWTAEIDVFEYKGTWHYDDDRAAARLAAIAAAKAMGKAGPKPIIVPQKLKDRYLTSAHTDHGKEDFGETIITPVNLTWNRVGLLWTRTHLNFYLNGVLVRSILNPGIHEPMFPILVLGIGTPMALQRYGEATGILNPADFDQTMIIDDVLIAQKPA